MPKAKSKPKSKKKEVKAETEPIEVTEVAVTEVSLDAEKVAKALREEEEIEKVEKQLIDKLWPTPDLVVEIAEEEEPSLDETEFLMNGNQEIPETAASSIKALQAQQEEEELKKFEENTKKLEAGFKAAKKRKLTPVTLKLTGENLERWHDMKDGMRVQMLNRTGISAVEKALFSEIEITDLVALKYLLSLHDEELERHQRQTQPVQNQAFTTMQKNQAFTTMQNQAFNTNTTPENTVFQPQQRQPARLTSNNPSSIVQPIVVPQRGPGGIGVSDVTVGGMQMSENDFFKMVATKKPKKIPKKRAYE